MSTRHVLIIPLNVYRHHLFALQRRLTDLYNDLYSEGESIVYTLDDYFAPDEHPDLYGNEAADVEPDRRDIDISGSYIQCSDARHIITEPQDVPTEQNNDANAQIDNMISRDHMEFFSD